MKRIIAAAALLSLAACGTPQPARIETNDVNVAVAQPCVVDTHHERPNLMTKTQVLDAMTAAPNVDSRAKIVTMQLLAYIGWLPVVEGAMQGCEAVPSPSSP